MLNVNRVNNSKYLIQLKKEMHSGWNNMMVSNWCLLSLKVIWHLF